MEEEKITQPESSEVKEPEQPTEITAEGKKKSGCLKGCLGALLVVLLIIGGGIFLGWRALNPNPGPIARALAETPKDEAATEAVNSSLTRNGFEQGVSALVLPLPDERGNPSEDKGKAVIMGLNLTGGFVPAPTEEGMRQQALDMVRAVVEANRSEGLDIQYSGCYFFSGGKQVASLSIPMEAMEAWVEGQKSDEQFLGAVRVKVHDGGYYTELAQEYLDLTIGSAISRALTDAIFRR